MNARNIRKLPPQFTDVNEEGVYRSMTQQSPAICVFLAYVDKPIHQLLNQ